SIPFNGQMIDVTKWEALLMLKRKSIDLWEIDNSGQIVLSSHGLFGFISPYGAGSTEPRTTINNIEDVATYGGNIETEIKDNLLREGIAYWDKNFSLEPYVQHITQLSDFGFITAQTADAMIQRMTDNYNKFASLRDPQIFSKLENEVNQLYNPELQFLDGYKSQSMDPTYYAFYNMGPGRILYVKVEEDIDRITGESKGTYSFSATITNDHRESGIIDYKVAYAMGSFDSGFNVKVNYSGVNLNHPTDWQDVSDLKNQLEFLFYSEPWKNEFQTIINLPENL
ncbi:hypothetical protein KY308_04220, partial [Candidatus Woesearchaeota archaeon]|nr:hypothetical protein [Candidatus Woesearchaeota archaeon]